MYAKNSMLRIQLKYDLQEVWKKTFYTFRLKGPDSSVTKFNQSLHMSAQFTMMLGEHHAKRSIKALEGDH